MVLVERMQALGDHARASRWRGDERSEEKEEKEEEEKEEKEEKQDSAARRAIIHEWENWAALNPDDLADPAAGAFFFSHLQQKKPELLNFLSDDKWQTVSAWLPREAHVRD
ncbi:MAG: hypothetical protein WB489_12795 [Pseudolabrys sp.]